MSFECKRRFDKGRHQDDLNNLGSRSDVVRGKEELVYAYLSTASKEIREHYAVQIVFIKINKYFSEKKHIAGATGMFLKVKTRLQSYSYLRAIQKHVDNQTGEGSSQSSPRGTSRICEEKIVRFIPKYRKIAS